MNFKTEISLAVTITFRSYDTIRVLTWTEELSVVSLI